MTATPKERTSATPTSVHYVDPDERTRERVASILEAEFEMEVKTTATATDALDHLDRRPADCVVSEVELPDMNAVKFFESVMQHPSRSRFIFFTTSPLEEGLDTTVPGGLTDYLRKDGEDRVQWLGTRIATATTTDESLERENARRSAGSCYLDEDLQITQASDSFTAMFGVGSNDLSGRPWSTVHADADHRLRRATVPVEVDATDRWAGRTEVVRNDGSPFPCRHSLLRLDSEQYLYTVVDLSNGPRLKRDDSVDSVGTAVRNLSSRPRSADGLNALFETSATRIVDALETDYVGIFEHRSDDETYVYRVGVGWNDDLDDPPALTAALFGSEQPLLTEIPVERWESESALKAAGSEQLLDHGIASGVAVPVFGPNGVWGVLGAFSATQRSYSSTEIAFLRTISALLTAALENERRTAEVSVFDELVGTVFEEETKIDVCNRFVDAADTLPELSFLAIYLIDEQTDTLHLSAQTNGEHGQSASMRIEQHEAEVMWNAFIENEPAFVAEVSPLPARTVPDPSLASGAVVPLEHHGVAVIGTTDPDRTIGSSVETTTAISALARSALDRIDRRRTLEEQTETLAKRSRTIDQLTEIDNCVRKIDRSIVETDSREALEHAVCEHLLEYAGVVFAWIGEYDDLTEAVSPTAWAGAEKSYLSAISIDLTDPIADQEPMAAAVDRRETYQRLRLLEDVPPEQWQREALRRGYRSVLSVPIVYQDFRYGGFTIYSDRPAAFDETERQTFEEVGERLGHAFNALDRKTALVESSGVIELEFHVYDDRIPFVHWSDETGCQFECETIVSRPDGTIRGFFTVDGVDPERILALSERSSAVDEPSLITEREEKSLFQCTLTEDSVGARVLEHGAVPTRMSASDGEGQIVVELPDNTNVREFVSVFQSTFPDSQLVRRRHRERHPQTRYEFKAQVEDELTERQLEVLRTAYFSGYFETPREYTGSEIASLLDIAQPTFNHHLRTAQRKLFGMLLTENRPDHCRSVDTE